MLMRCRLLDYAETEHKEGPSHGSIKMMRAFVLGTVISFAIFPATGQTLRATSRLVQLNVLVHDAKDKPVRDLTKDDFVVLDEGRQRGSHSFGSRRNWPRRLPRQLRIR
jgi:hypothetical protein